MSALVADTHAVVWLLQGSPKLSAKARQAMEGAIAAGYSVLVATISLVEIAYLVEKQRLPTAAWTSLLTHLRNPQSGFFAVPFTLKAAEAVPSVPYASVPDMPDRMIAAVALSLGLPLVTRDHHIQAPNLATIW